MNLHTKRAFAHRHTDAHTASLLTFVIQKTVGKGSTRVIKGQLHLGLQRRCIGVTIVVAESTQRENIVTRHGGPLDVHVRVSLSTL
jgi:hypothetical protein